MQLKNGFTLNSLSSKYTMKIVLFIWFPLIFFFVCICHFPHYLPVYREKNNNIINEVDLCIKFLSILEKKHEFVQLICAVCCVDTNAVEV